jgi:hypothetical protein
MSAASENGSSDFIAFSREMFSWIGELLTYSLNLIKQYWYIFLLLTGGSMAYHYWNYQQTPALYSATAQLGHNELVKKVYGEMIVELQRLIDHGADEEISALLDFPVERVNQIVSVRATNVAGSALHEDITISSLPFYLHVKTTEAECIPLLEHGLQYYLENCHRNQKLYTTNLRVLREKQEFYEMESRRIDGIITTYQEALSGDALEDKLEFELAELFRLKEDFLLKSAELEFAVSHYRPVDYIYGFSTTERPYKDYNWRSALFSIGFFVFLSLGIAWIIDLFREARSA